MPALDDKHKRLRFAVSPLAVAAVLSCVPASAGPTLAGRYGSLTLAVAGDAVTGVFWDERVGNGSADAPQFSCIFELAGKLQGDVAQVRTGLPGDTEAPIRGTLRVTGGRVSLQLAEDPGGCTMTGDIFSREPYEEERDADGSGWLGVGLVQRSRAVLHTQPEDRGEKRPYLVEFDPVVILERRPAWLRVRFLGNKPVSGWLPANALYPPMQP